MKKSIILIASVCAAACCFGACENNVADTSQYDQLNEMLNASYSQIVLTVENTFDEHTSLKSEYVINYSESVVTVNYTVEKFATIEADLDGTLSDIKTTLVGEAKIKDGVVFFVEGDDISLTADIAQPGLTFKKEYFENVDLTGVYLMADVKNASAFLGSQITCTDMHVKATFLEVFYNIDITYTSAGGSQVAYSYAFTL